MPKIVNGNIYVHRMYVHALTSELMTWVNSAVVFLPVGCGWNLIKIDTDKSHVTFSEYPEFDALAHPELRQWNRIDFVSGEVKVGKGSLENPTILHRKETFVDSSHRDFITFSRLTRQELAVGLYAKEHLSRIGHKLYWEQLLVNMGLEIVDHSLRYISGKEVEIGMGRGRER